MAPFLAETLEDLLRRFYAKFIRPDVLVNAKTSVALMKIDISSRENQLTDSKLDIGFSLKYDLQQLKSKGKITDVQIDKFKQGVRDFLVAMCNHITEKSPLSSLMARCLKSLSPTYMAECPEICKLLFEKILMKLVSNKKIAASLADLAKREFSKFCHIIVLDNKEEFLSFDKDKDRLDYFLWKFTDVKMFANLQSVFKILLILSHGQAQVGRGFSSNKSLIDDNMSTDTIIALRSVHDHLKFHNLNAHEVENDKGFTGWLQASKKRVF